MSSLSLGKAALYDEEMSIGKRIKAQREVRHLTQKTLAKRLGISVQAISQWENDKTVPEAERLRDISIALNSDFYWLFEGSIDAGPIAQRYETDDQRIWRAPLIDRVVAGTWSEATTPETLPADTRYLDVYIKPMGKIFAFEISGESMEPEFATGDLVIIDTGLDPLPGDFVVASNSEEGSTFKKLKVSRNAVGERMLELVPLNCDYPTLVLDSASPGRVIGTMIEHRRFRRRR